MAFTVTPTSGAAPYVFNIEFVNAVNFGSDYSLEFATVSQTDVCNFDYNRGNNAPLIADSLLASGTYTLSEPSVPAGTCRSYNVRVRRLSDGALISGMTATVDNIV